MAKNIVILISLSFFTGLIACGDDGLDIPDVPLSGNVNGEEWEFKFGSFRQFSSTEYEFRFYSTKESVNDPCSIYASTHPFLRVIIPAAQTSHSLPIIDPLGIKQFKFDFGDGSTLNGTSGFIELFPTDGFRLQGYLQAVTDDDNTIEGRFELDPC